jgi:superfamily II DNA or RNA helicase
VKLRDYQHEAALAILREWDMVPSTLVVMPTGCGKTILFADVIRRMFPLKAIVLAHREELIFQARDKIQAVTGFDVEIEMADARACMGGGLFDGPQVIVSTIQTQTAGGDGGGRMGKFDPYEFGVLIVDEAHHAVADTYRRAIAYYRTNPDLRVLGVTATPDRADEMALGQVYETVAFDYELHNAIRDGWLVPIEQQLVAVEGLDFSGVRTTAGDLNGADLAAVMEYEKNLHGIADPTLQIIGDRRALVFAASVAHAERLADIFNRHRPGTAGWLCGKTEKEDRRRILADFAAGRLRIVVNVGVLTEGFDDPGVEVIVMGRPTKSRSLYAQMVGRATRPLPGLVDGLPDPQTRCDAIARSAKPACLVVDFVGNAGRHKLVSTADILGGNVSEAAAAAALAQARATGKPVRMDDALTDAQAEIDERHALEEARRARIIGKATFRTSKLDPFDILGLQPVAARGWDVGKQLSEKQRGLLAKQGIDPDGLPYTQARQIIGELFRRWDGDLCSFKQAKLLRKYGYDANVSRTEAKGIIDRIVAAGWRRPAEEAAFA